MFAIGACSDRSCGPWARSGRESDPEAVRVALRLCRDSGADGGDSVLAVAAAWEVELSPPVECPGSTLVLESGERTPLGVFSRMRTKQGREYIVSSMGVFRGVDGGALEVTVDCARLAPKIHGREFVRSATLTADCSPVQNDD